MDLLIVGIIGLGILGASWLFFIEPRWIEISRYEVKIQKKLAAPLSILHLSDTHFSGRNLFLNKFFDKLSQDTYDIAVITGDIIDCPKGISQCVEALKKIKTRFGFFAVLGNHDYFNYGFLDAFNHNFPYQTYPSRKNDADKLQKELMRINIKVLKNQTEEINVPEEKILIHGLDDPTTGRADVKLIQPNFNPQRANILLTHTVDALQHIEEGNIDVSFSGHSHGGQIRFPGVGAVIAHTTFGRNYAGGLKKLKGVHCCISRGTSSGRFLTPRLFCRPEAIIVKVLGE